jgi:hypothetical protein
VAKKNLANPESKTFLGVPIRPLVVLMEQHAEEATKENGDKGGTEDHQLDSGTDDSTLHFDFIKQGAQPKTREALNEKEKDRLTNCIAFDCDALYRTKRINHQFDSLRTLLQVSSLATKRFMNLGFKDFDKER